MIERGVDRFGAISRAVRNERGQLVVSGTVVRGEGRHPARVDWAANPQVHQLSYETAGEMQEALGELRTNMWQLEALSGKR
jgi:hypothetical protein